jgi:CheY-like chemotaxis protein
LVQELRALTGQPPLSQILIVDDEERDRYILKQKLKNLPLLVTEARNGTEGLRFAVERKPDLIFLDLWMPDLTGSEVLDTLNQDPATAGIPVVIITSQALMEAERSQLGRRAVAIVDKERLNKTDFSDLVSRAIKPQAIAGNGL